MGDHNKVVATPIASDDDMASEIMTDIVGTRVYRASHVNTAVMPGRILHCDPIVSISSINSSQPNDYVFDVKGNQSEINVPRYFSPLERLGDTHEIGGLPSQMKKLVWQHELSFVEDKDQRDYLSKGIEHGFRIVDNVQIPSYECDNYSSCTKPPAKTYIDNLFRDEICQGIVVQTNVKPHCVHAIGAISKKDGTYRPITDCRRPLGSSINNYMDSTCHTFKHKTLDLLCDQLSRGDFMCCTDIKAAYRSSSIFPEHRKFQGFKWTCVEGRAAYYYDTRLSFGLKCAPFIFNEISDFIVQSMYRRGYDKVVNYLDDYFCWGSTFFQECANTQNALIQLLGQLGFRIAWNKCSSPSTTCTYLGIEIDSRKMTMRLPREKMCRLMHELDFFKDRSRATLKQLQRLCGVLSYASRVVRGGRTFSRRVIDLLKGLPLNTGLTYRLIHHSQDLECYQRIVGVRGFSTLMKCLVSFERFLYWNRTGLTYNLEARPVKT